MKAKLKRILSFFCCFLIVPWSLCLNDSLTVFAEDQVQALIGDQIEVEPEIAALAEARAVSTQSGNVIRTVYNAGGPSLSSVLGISRASVLNVLGSHLNDNYYLGTPYKGGDHRNPAGDPLGYGSSDVSGVPGMNCTGFVWHVLTGAGGKNVPAISGWVVLLKNYNVEYITFQRSSGTADAEVIQALSKEARPGDIIWCWDGNAGALVNGLCLNSSAKHHIGIYVGSYFNDKLTPGNPTGCWNRTDSLAWWHSIDSYDGDASPGVNHVSQIVAKSSSPSSFTLIHLDNPKPAAVSLQKTSALPEFTVQSPIYQLENTIYGIYTDSECSRKAAELQTDSNGISNTVELPAGNYWVREMFAPSGFLPDDEIYPITLRAGDKVCLEFQDIPNTLSVDILCRKADADTGLSVPAGGASLEAAEFTVRYYPDYYDSDPTQADPAVPPCKTWILKTDADGICKMTEDYKVSGDSFFTIDGTSVLPPGTITIQETKAPEGYLPNPEIFVRQILPPRIEYALSPDTDQDSDSSQDVPIFQEILVPEQVIRGDLELYKYGEASEAAKSTSGSQTSNPLANVSFTLTSVTTGQVFRICTDADGYASTASLELDPRGSLPYDTYLVHEENPPKGYLPVADFECTISEEGQTLSFTLTDQKEPTPTTPSKPAAGKKAVPTTGDQPSSFQRIFLPLFLFSLVVILSVFIRRLQKKSKKQ